MLATLDLRVPCEVFAFLDFSSSFTSADLLPLPRSHLRIFSRSSFYLSLTAGAIPPERPETQPFRTKWTLDVKNCGKIAILRCPTQPFRTKWTLDVKNCFEVSIAILSHEMDVGRQKLR